MMCFYELGDFAALCQFIARESTRHATQNGSTIELSGKDIEEFFGILYYTGLVKLPKIRDYWRTDEIGSIFVQSHMTRKRFEEIWKNLHFSDNNDRSLDGDKARTVRPIISHLNFCYQDAAMNEEHQSVDEHMIKFKGRSQMKQNIKNKPVKWGFKMWQRCGAASGYLYEFDLYTGRKDRPELGLGEQVVLDLTKKLEKSYVKIFCDNYFTSPSLCLSLLNSGIYLTGVVKNNRKLMPEFKSDKDMSRGDMDIKSAKNVPIMCVKWG